MFAAAVEPYPSGGDDKLEDGRRHIMLARVMRRSHSWLSRCQSEARRSCPTRLLIEHCVLADALADDTILCRCKEPVLPQDLESRPSFRTSNKET
jgi:hypothetical protein